MTDDWRVDAACRQLGLDPELWFSEKHVDGSHGDALLAKRICELCPVRVHCARSALRVGATYGIWAGYSVGNCENLPRLRALARQRNSSDRRIRTFRQNSRTELRERITALTAEGRSAADIARRLGIHPRTVTRHRARHNNHEAAS